MSTCVMLDLETLGTHPDCVVLTIGAIKFNPFTMEEPGNGLYLRLDIEEQLNMGRSTLDSTIDWWAQQDPKVREEAMGEEGYRAPIAELRKELNKFLVGVEHIWCQGPAFDIVILEDLYRSQCWPIPWHFWQIRDSRTLFGVHGDPREKGRDQAHNALMDCYYQAIGVQKVYNRLNVTPGT
jgi:hypothetical protein